MVDLQNVKYLGKVLRCLPECTEKGSTGFSLLTILKSTLKTSPKIIFVFLPKNSKAFLFISLLVLNCYGSHFQAYELEMYLFILDWKLGF